MYKGYVRFILTKWYLMINNCYYCQWLILLACAVWKTPPCVNHPGIILLDHINDMNATILIPTKQARFRHPAYLHHRKVSPSQRSQELFLAFDVSGDGAVTQRELLGRGVSLMRSSCGGQFISVDSVGLL